jgi:hypothetical protein
MVSTSLLSLLGWRKNSLLNAALQSIMGLQELPWNCLYVVVGHLGRKALYRIGKRNS